MPDLFQRLRRNLERDERVLIAAPPPGMQPADPLPPPPVLPHDHRDAEADIDYKAQAESLLRQVAAKDKHIGMLQEQLAAVTPADSPPADAVGRIDQALDANLRETNQRLRANLRAAEAMIALRDGVSVDDLTVPWPKQTPARSATRA